MFCVDYFEKRSKELQEKAGLKWELTPHEKDEFAAIMQALRFIHNVPEERIQNAKLHNCQ